MMAFTLFNPEDGTLLDHLGIYTGLSLHVVVLAGAPLLLIYIAFRVLRRR